MPSKATHKALNLATARTREYRRITLHPVREKRGGNGLQLIIGAALFLACLAVMFGGR